MLIKRPADVRSSEITDKKWYLNRRQFIQAAGGTAAATALGVIGSDIGLEAATPAPHGRKLENVKPSTFSVDPKVDKPNRWEDITTYNNYYEFGVDKDSPSMSVGKSQPRSMDGHGQRRVQQEGGLAHGGHPQGPGAGGSHLSASLRRALVDGHSVGRVSAFGFHQEVRADVEGQVHQVHDALRSQADARGATRDCAGRTSRACAWTRRCTR